MHRGEFVPRVDTPGFYPQQLFHSAGGAELPRGEAELIREQKGGVRTTKIFPKWCHDFEVSYRTGIGSDTRSQRRNMRHLFVWVCSYLFVPSPPSGNLQGCLQLFASKFTNFCVPAAPGSVGRCSPQSLPEREREREKTHFSSRLYKQRAQKPQQPVQQLPEHFTAGQWQPQDWSNIP